MLIMGGEKSVDCLFQLVVSYADQKEWVQSFRIIERLVQLWERGEDPTEGYNLYRIFLFLLGLKETSYAERILKTFPKDCKFYRQALRSLTETRGSNIF